MINPLPAVFDVGPAALLNEDLLTEPGLGDENSKIDNEFNQK